jgi:nucleotide-binding universal stress UspA family protein
VRVLSVENGDPLRPGGELSAERAARVLAGVSGAEPRVRSGRPADEILAEAREWEADLVVMGSHGRAGAGRFFLGSVAEAMARQAPCAVLIVPPSPMAFANEAAPVLRAG